MVALIRAYKPIINPSKYPSQTPTNTPTLDMDDMGRGCVAYDIRQATHPDMSAVDAGFDPAIHHETEYHVM